MIPGVTAVGNLSVSQLPSAFDLSDEDSLTTLLTAPFEERVYLLEASPYNVDTEALAAIRWANKHYKTLPTDSLVSKEFAGVLRKPYNVQVSVFNGGRLAARSIPAFGEITVANTSGTLDAAAAYSWAERALTIKAGLPTFRYDQFGLIFTGTAEGVTWNWLELAVRVRDYQYKLSKPLQPTLYGGFGAALKFDGVDDKAIGSPTCPTGAMTIQARAFTSILDNNGRGMVGWRNGASAGLRLLYQRGSDNTISFAAINDTGSTFEAVSAPTIDQWAIWSGVLDTGAAQIRLYRDATLVATTAIAGAFTTVATSFGVGVLPDILANFWSGGVDEVRVWSYARTGADIAEDYRRELLGTETNLSYYVRFNEATGTSATPTTGTGTLTITGATWIGSLEGDASIAGKPKPKSLGQVRQVEPVPVDTTNLIYQWNDGAVSAVNGLGDAGVALTSAGNVSDLYATTVTSGQFKTNNSRGLIRLGALPVGTLTLDGQGDASGSGYVYKAADIIRRIVTTAGAITDPGGLDTASFTAAAAANTAVHGYHSRLDPVDIETAVDELAASIGAFWTYTRDGLFRIVVFTAPGTPVATLSESDFVMDSMVKQVTPPPSKRVRLGYKKYYTTQEGDALATSVTAADRALYAETYRFTSDENSTIATAYLDAEETEAATLMDTLADAQAEATRRIGLYGVKRQLIKLRLVVGLFTYKLGDTLEFASTLSRFDLAGWKGVIVGLVEDVGDDTAPAGVIEVELWG